MASGESFDEWRIRTINLFLECFGGFVFLPDFDWNCFFLEATELFGPHADHAVDGSFTEDIVFTWMAPIITNNRKTLAYNSDDLHIFGSSNHVCSSHKKFRTFWCLHRHFFCLFWFRLLFWFETRQFAPGVMVLLLWIRPQNLLVHWKLHLRAHLRFHLLRHLRRDMFQMTPQGLIDFVCGIVLCIGVKTFCLYFAFDDNFPNTWNDPKAVSQHVEKIWCMQNYYLGCLWI